MFFGRFAFGWHLVVVPGSTAHGYHNPGAVVPAAPVAGVIAVFGAWGGRQLARYCRVWSCCQVPGFVEACLGRFLSCCCVFVFCLLRCDSAQGEVRAACVVPVDPG